MWDLFAKLLDLRLGYFLVVVGIVFLLIAVIGKIRGKIDPGRTGRIVAGIVGTFLLIGGLVLTIQFPNITPKTIVPLPPTATTMPSSSLNVVVRSADSPLDTRGYGSATASCQGGEVMVGGGFTSVAPNTSLIISENYPTNKNAWTVAYSLFTFYLPPLKPVTTSLPTPTPISPRVLVTAYAVCVSFNRSLETDIATTNSSMAQQSLNALLPEAQCKQGYMVLSGGYRTPFNPSSRSRGYHYGWAPESYPSSATGWRVVGAGPSGNYQAYVLCGKGAIAEQSTISTNPFTRPENTSAHVSMRCSNNQLLAGGGFQVEASLGFLGSSFASNGPQRDDSQWIMDTVAPSGTMYVVCVQFSTT